MRLLILLAACRPGATPPWTPPVFEGDGLPPSADTAHDRDRTDTGVTLTGTGDTGSASVSFDVQDGLFGWYDYQSYGVYGYLALLEEPLGCAELFGAYVYPDGVYFTLVAEPSAPEEGFAGHWGPCGQAPCQQAFWLLGGEFGYLDGWVDVTAYDAHYLTVDWSTEVSSGEGLTFYNCGDALPWAGY